MNTAKYTDQFGRQFAVPALDDPRKQHKVAKNVAKSMLTPPELARYMDGEFNIHVVDELGRKHHMMFAAALGSKAPR